MWESEVDEDGKRDQRGDENELILSHEHVLAVWFTVVFSCIIVEDSEKIMEQKMRNLFFQNSSSFYSSFVK